VKDSPGIDTHKPVSRQHEAEYLRYYGYPLYWGGPNLWGMGEYPVPGFIGTAPITADVRQQLSLYGDKPAGDVHLRCASHVERYVIEAADGSVGHVCGFIFDDEAWVVRYFIVDTRNWWPGRQGSVAGDAVDRRYRLVCIFGFDVANAGSHQGQSRIR
jgi:hypothetical protein